MSSPEPRRTGAWRRIRRSVWTPLITVVIALALIQGFAVKMYQIPSGSMEPTLEVGDRILVNRLPSAQRIVEVGDIVAFEEPESWGEPRELSVLRRVAGWFGDVVGFGPSNTLTVVKRVIAAGGQEVTCCDGEGAVLVDGAAQSNPPETHNFPFVTGELDCLTSPASRRCFSSFVVPEGEYFVLGDHRASSADSLRFCHTAEDTAECVVTVPQKNLIGPVLVRVWPLDEIGRPDGPAPEE